MKYFIVDVEVYPEWACVVIKERGSAVYKLVTTDDLTKIWDLFDIINYKQNILVGYNIKNYDLILISNLFNLWRAKTPGVEIAKKLFVLSEKIINREWTQGLPYNLCSFTDLRDDLSEWLSLKEYESNKGLAIKETTVEFGKKNLTDGEKDEIIAYCKEDVDATDQLLTDRWNYVQTKARLATRFGLDPLNALKKTAPSVVCDILVQNRKGNRDFLNRPITYVVPPQIDAYIREALPKWLIDVFLDYEHFDVAEKTFTLFDNQITIGLGGLHSVHNNNGNGGDLVLNTSSTPDRLILNIDVVSYYPHLIVNFDYQSRSVTDKGLYPQILVQRTELKSKLTTNPEFKDDVDDLKLILNSAGGAMKQKYLSLYDPEQNVRMCFTGQLLLMALCKKMYDLYGADIIQTNTDGICMAIPTDKKREIYGLIKQWEGITNMLFEYTPVQTIWQNNVNNYVLTTKAGKIKNVGAWLNYDIDPFHNICFPIIQKAMFNYLVHNIPIQDTVLNEKNPMMFLYTVKRGATFTGTIIANHQGTKKLGKINRIYATVSPFGGTIYKVKGQHRQLAPNCPEKAQIYNDVVTVIPNDIDYDWYIKKAQAGLRSLIRVSI